ncbi:T9SS type A sorting domain-containing protein [Flavilitoribacter nigricans]|nr:T9SS type A sorting domain-containing protein [Flavilitoribacter nigricans]
MQHYAYRYSRMLGLLFYCLLAALPSGFGQEEPDELVPCTIETCPPSVKVSCGELLDPTALGEPELIGDDCEEATVTYSDALGGGACSQTIVIVRTWTVTDTAGNATTCKQSIEIVDESDPVIVDLPDDSIDGCATEWPTLKTTWSDNCADGGEITAEMGPIETSEDDDCIQFRIYTFTITDACGNSATETTKITRDNSTTKPEVKDLPNFTIECGDDWPDLETNWWDDCDGEGKVAGVPGPVKTDGYDLCKEYRIYTFKYVNGCGKYDEETTKVTRLNGSAQPEVKDLPNFTIDCGDDWPELETTWWDDCLGEGKIVGVPGPVMTNSYNPCQEYRTYTFKFTNACGKLDVETTTVTRLNGSAKPEVKDLPDMTIDCGDDWPELKTNWWDDCQGEGKVVGVPGEVKYDGYNPCVEYRIYTFKFTNACGKSDTETTKVTRYNGSAKPEVKDLPDMTIDCGDDWPELKTNWWDDCQGEGKVVGVPGEVKYDGYNPCVEYRIYTFKFTNACGKSDTETTKVTRYNGSAKPEVKDLPDMTIDCGDDWPELKTNWWDDCQGEGKVVGVPGEVKYDGYNPCVEYRIYTFKFTNACGKSDTETTKVTRYNGSSKPEVKDLPDMTIDCGDDWPELKTNWWDDCQGEGKVVGVPGEVKYDGYNPCVEYRIYTFKFTNACGKSDTETTKVTRYNGSSKPEVKDLPDMTIDCGDDWPELKTNWWDDCQGEGKVVGVPGEVKYDGYNPCVEYRIYTFKFSNACGKFDTETTKVTRYNGSAKPEVKDLPDMTIDCGDDWPELKTNWWDDCQGEGKVVGVPGEVKYDGYNPCIEYRIYTFKFTNACGKSDTETTKVTRYNGSAKPEVKDLPDMTIDCGDDWPELKTNWWDDCQGEGKVVGVPGEVKYDGYNPCVEYRIYTFKFTNACGKSDTETTKVTRYNGSAKPEVKDLPDMTIDCGDDWPELKTNWWDDCQGEGKVVGVPGEVKYDGYNPCIEYRIYTFKFTNACGKSDTETTKVTRYNGSAKPEVKDLPDMTIDCGDDWPELKTNWWDDCQGEGKVVGVPGEVKYDGYNPCIEYRIYTFKFTNACGKSDTETTKVTRYNGSAKPEVKDLPDMTIDCGDDWPELKTNWWDDCQGEGKVVGVPGEVKYDGYNPCIEYRIYTFKFTNACGKSDTETTKVTRYNGSAKPEVKDLPDMTIDCGDDWPELKTNWWDDCQGEGKVVGVPGEVKYDGYNPCIEYRIYTFKFTNACGKSDEETTKVTRYNGSAKPEVKDLPDMMIDCGDNWPELKTNWWDDCQGEGQVVGVPGPVQYDGYNPCIEYRIYTFKFTNACGKYDLETTKVTRKDNKAPELPVLGADDLTCYDEIPDLDELMWLIKEGVTDNCDDNPTAEIIKDTGEPTCEYGSFSRTFTVRLCDACGNCKEVDITYSGTCSGMTSYCTTTQGGWGNQGTYLPWNNYDGMASSKDIIAELIATYGNIVIGRQYGGSSLTIQSADCVMALLPGTGKPGRLPSGDKVSKSEEGCAPYGGDALSPDGRLNNSMATQTIALQLNLWYGMKMHGKSIGELRIGDKGLDLKIKDLPSIIKTVDDLLTYANLQLAGAGGSSYNSMYAIAEALTKVNQYFTGCEMTPVYECEGEVPDPDCEDFCTLTQGGWGNAGGKYPWSNDNGKAGTLDIISALMTTYGDILLGDPEGNSLSIQNAQCVIDLLPGGGQPGVLPEGDMVADGGNCKPYGDDKLNNLATQTVALQLNLWYNLALKGINLGGLELDGKCLDIDLGHSMDDHQLLLVQDLLDFANLYLSGQIGSDKSVAGKLTEAIAEINEEFNNCGAAYSVLPETDATAPDQFRVYPNPATDHAELQYEAQEDGTLMVRIMDANGQLIKFREFEVVKGLNYLELITERLSSGMYYIVTQKDKVMLQDRIVIMEK